MFKMLPCGSGIILVHSTKCGRVTIDALNYFWFKRRYSFTNILTNLGLPSFDTVLYNTVCSFQNLRTFCSNRLVMHLRD